MKYRIYPPGWKPHFDPKGKTREQIQRQELLASLVRISDYPPDNEESWYQEANESPDT